MTDRELLELAVKACGYKGAEWREFANAVPSMVIPYGVDRGDGVIGYLWNPLTNDGDALRLAVKLGLCVDVQIPITEVWVCPPNDEQELVIERMNGDRLAATRRAIVRAAAEIGRRMES